MSSATDQARAIYWLVRTEFDIDQASEKSKVSKSRIKNWCKNDPNFIKNMYASIVQIYKEGIEKRLGCNNFLYESIYQELMDRIIGQKAFAEVDTAVLLRELTRVASELRVDIKFGSVKADNVEDSKKGNLDKLQKLYNYKYNEEAEKEDYEANVIDIGGKKK